MVGALGVLPILAVLLTDGAEPQVEAPTWEFSMSVYSYFVPEESNYVQPTFTAERGAVHLEGRLNYEDRETGSVWVGYKFSFGREVSFDIIPMLGGVFGAVSGIAPGYRGVLDWRWLELYSEGEYVFDYDDHLDSFFYAWSEVTASPASWLRAGVVGQRTQAFESSPELQRGLLVRCSIKNTEISVHAFNLHESTPLYVLSAAVEF